MNTMHIRRGSGHGRFSENGRASSPYSDTQRPSTTARLESNQDSSMEPSVVMDPSALLAQRKDESDQENEETATAPQKSFQEIKDESGVVEPVEAVDEEMSPMNQISKSQYTETADNTHEMGNTLDIPDHNNDNGDPKLEESNVIENSDREMAVAKLVSSPLGKSARGARERLKAALADSDPEKALPVSEPASVPSVETSPCNLHSKSIITETSKETQVVENTLDAPEPRSSPLPMSTTQEEYGSAEKERAEEAAVSAISSNEMDKKNSSKKATTTKNSYPLGKSLSAASEFLSSALAHPDPKMDISAMLLARKRLKTAMAQKGMAEI